MAEGDWTGWKLLTKEIGDNVQLVGDDVFVTNPEILKRGIDEKVGNALLVKVNQMDHDRDVEQRRLCADAFQFQRKLARGRNEEVSLALFAQRPVVDLDVERACCSLGQAEPGARRFLAAHQRTPPLIADRRVREEHLPCDEARRIVFVDAGPIAKERELEAERLAVLVLDPARHVPPFGAELRVAAFVTRQLDGVARGHGGILDIGCARRRACDEQERDRRVRNAPHQSSFTALTTSALIACRPLTTAIPAAAAISTALSEVSNQPGAARSMLQ